MYNRPLLFIILLHFFLSHSLSAQQLTLDRTLPRLDSLSASEEKVDVLLIVARAYRYVGNIRLERKNLAAAKKMAQQLDYQVGYGKALIEESITEFNLGHDDEAEVIQRRASALAAEINSNKFQFICDHSLAEFYLFSNNDYKTAIGILEKILSNADESVSIKNIARANRALGICYSAQGDTLRALQTFEQVVTLLDTKQAVPDAKLLFDDRELILGRVYESMGSLYWAMGKLEQGLIYYQKALTIYEKWGAFYFIAGVASPMARILLQQGKVTDALLYCKKATEIVEKMDSDYLAADAQLVVGEIYQRIGDFNEAEQLYLSSLNFVKQIDDSLMLWENYQKLGTLEFDRNQPEPAHQWLNQALTVAEAIQDSFSIGRTAKALGNVALLQKDNPSADKYLHSALGIYQSLNKTNKLPAILLDIAQLFKVQNQLDSAIFYGQRALEFAQQNQDEQQIKNGHLALSQFYDSTKSYERALFHHQAFFRYHDRIYTKNMQQIVKAEQIRQNVAYYQKEKATAEANIALLAQRNQLYLALGATFLLLFLASGYLFLGLRKSKREIENKNRQLTTLNQAKDRFFGIIAHEIRSPMVALQSVGRQMDFNLKKGNLERVTQLANLVTQTTNRLDTLLDNLLNWALLQRGLIVARPDTLSVQQCVYETTDLFAGSLKAKEIQLQVEIPKEHQVWVDKIAFHTVLRNLLSNAIKFTPEAGKVMIHSKSVATHLVVKVSNSGRGIPIENLKRLFTLERKSTKGTKGEPGTGLGLILCKELLDLNQGSITAFNENGKGATFEISLPNP